MNEFMTIDESLWNKLATYRMILAEGSGAELSKGEIIEIIDSIKRHQDRGCFHWSNLLEMVCFELADRIHEGKYGTD